jgi:L-fuculose-phosphate aldolase
LKVEDVVLVNLNNEILYTKPGLKPSSETDIHLAIYTMRDDIGAIVHTHSTFAIVVSTGNNHIIPWSDESLCLRGVPIIPRLDYNRTAQIKEVLEALGKESRCVIVKYHGSFCCGTDLDDAKMYALEVERASKIMYFAMLQESAKPIPFNEATKLLGKPPLITY